MGRDSCSGAVGLGRTPGSSPRAESARTSRRELNEEVGLTAADVEIIARTGGWLRYRLPKRYIRRHAAPICIGQKQKWFLLRLLAEESKVRFDVTDKPEFDHWRWVSYWYPLRQVVSFKREVYRQALQELAPHLFAEMRLQHRAADLAAGPHP